MRNIARIYPRNIKVIWQRSRSRSFFFFSILAYHDNLGGLLQIITKINRNNTFDPFFRDQSLKPTVSLKPLGFLGHILEYKLYFQMLDILLYADK